MSLEGDSITQKIEQVRAYQLGSAETRSKRRSSPATTDLLEPCFNQKNETPSQNGSPSELQRKLMNGVAARNFFTTP